MSIRVLVVISVALMIPDSSCGRIYAQFGGNGAVAGNANMVTNFKGTLKGFQRGVLIVTREDGTDVSVQPPDDMTRFQFVAKARPAFLNRGTMVRFNGTFAKNGTPQSIVDKVEIFEPIHGKVPNQQRERFLPGVHPSRDHQPNDPIAKCSVVGRLIGLDASGVIVVQAGNQQVRAQVSADAKFEVRVNSLSLAKEGDIVSVAGFYQPPDETKVKAGNVTITTDRIYGEPSAENAKPVRRRTREERKTEAKETAAKDAADTSKAAEDAPVGEKE